MCGAVFHQWLHEYFPSKRLLSLVCRRNIYLWRSAANNAIFKNRTQNIECSFGCVAHSAILLKPNIANDPLFNFCEQKFVQYGPITICINYYGLSLLFFEEKGLNYASGPKSTPKQWLVLGVLVFQCMSAGFLCPKCDNFACLHTRQDQMSFIWEDDFFFAKIGIFCNSIAGPLPSVVQAHTQPYSFGGRIKLIICQVRHELSVTIHEIRFSWKKKR